MDGSIQIGNIMQRDVKIIGPNASLRAAAMAMARLDAGVLPVGEGTSWSE